MLEKEDKTNRLFAELHAQNINMLLIIKECLELDMGLHKLFNVSDEHARVLLENTSANIRDLSESGSKIPLFQLKCSAQELEEILNSCRNPLSRAVAQDPIL